MNEYDSQDVTHNPIVLDLWWEYLNFQFLQKGRMTRADGFILSEAVLYCDNNMSKSAIDKKFTDRRVTKNEINFFPGQHCILPCLDFEAKTIEVIPLYRYDSPTDSWIENPAYFEAWRMWKIREISNESFVPEDLKKIFVDELGILISEIDLSELENPNAMVAKCHQQMVERLDA